MRAHVCVSRCVCAYACVCVCREPAEAVGCAPCEMPQMESFKRKAVAAFGEPQSWSEGQVMALANSMGRCYRGECVCVCGSVRVCVCVCVCACVEHVCEVVCSLEQWNGLEVVLM